MLTIRDACRRPFVTITIVMVANGRRQDRCLRLTCGSMLEVSRDARRTTRSMCTVTLDPCGGLPFTSWGRWQCLRGGADTGLNSCYASMPPAVAAQNVGVATCLRRWRAFPLRSPTQLCSQMDGSYGRKWTATGISNRQHICSHIVYENTNPLKHIEKTITNHN